MVWIYAIWPLNDRPMLYENFIQSKGGILSQENKGH